MQNKIFSFSLLLVLCLFQQFSFAQEDADKLNFGNKLWPDRSPLVLEPGRKVWPLLGVKRVGARNNMEWRIQPLFFFASPHLGLKKLWKKNENGFSFSTLHQINYPTIYLRLIAREGAGGVLPKDSQIPPMINLRNEVLLGFNSQGNFFTLRGGLATAFKLGSAEKNFPDIDFPFLYSRTLALNHSPNIYLGLNFNRSLTRRINLEADFAAFSVGNSDNDFVYESQLIFFWKKSDRFGLKAGAAAAHGQYPFGSVFQVIPVFDIVFGFGKYNDRRND